MTRRIVLAVAIVATLAMALDGAVSYAAGHVVGYAQLACLVTWGGCALAAGAEAVQHRRWGR